MQAHKEFHHAAVERRTSAPQTANVDLKILYKTQQQSPKKKVYLESLDGCKLHAKITSSGKYIQAMKNSDNLIPTLT